MGEFFSSLHALGHIHNTTTVVTKVIRVMALSSLRATVKNTSKINRYFSSPIRASYQFQ